MKQKLLLLMAFALISLGVKATDSAWQLYVYDNSASATVVNNIYFQTTEDTNVFKLEGVNITTANNWGFSICIHQNWSSMHGTAVNSPTIGTPYEMGETTTSVWFGLSDGTYDVTWNAIDNTIQFDEHIDTDLADWYLYFYKADPAIDTNIQFHTTATEHVFTIEGLRLEETNVYLSVHNNGWSSKYSADVTTAGSDTNLPASESASGLLSVGTGIYDVTWNESTCEITFIKRYYPDYIAVYATRDETDTQVGIIYPKNQDFGTYEGQLIMTAWESFYIYTVTGETWTAMKTNSSTAIVPTDAEGAYNMWADGTEGIQTFEFDISMSSNAWSCTYAGAATITIGSEGYATFYSDWDYDVPEGLTGYIIYPNGTDGTLTLESVSNEVPAGTGVLYAGSAGSYEVTFKSTQSSAYTNRLGGTHFATTVNTWEGSDGKNVLLYKLANDDTNGLGWYWDSEDGQSLDCGANKCYLWLTQTEAGYTGGGSVKSFIPLFGDETAISTVKSEVKADAPVYTLSGVRVNPSQAGRGIYIQNGKKFINK